MAPAGLPAVRSNARPIASALAPRGRLPYSSKVSHRGSTTSSERRVTPPRPATPEFLVLRSRFLWQTTPVASAQTRKGEAMAPSPHQSAAALSHVGTVASERRRDRSLGGES